MKKIIIASFVICFAFALPLHAQEACILKKGMVDNIKIGMNGAEAKKQYSPAQLKEKKISMEGEVYTNYEVYPNSAPKNSAALYMFEIYDGKVSRITVNGKACKTSKGVGVGSKFADLKGNHKITTVSNEATEGQQAIVEDLQMTFCFKTPFTGKGSPSINSIPNDALIQQIFIW